MQSNRHSCQILIKLIVSTDVPKKISQVTFHKKIRPIGAELFHADGHDETKSRFSQFCERAYK